MHQFRHRYGPTALITGAAQGLGAAFADACAARGLDVVLVDQRADLLHERARSIAARARVNTQAVVVDLAAPDFLDAIRAAIKGTEIGLLINNAAIGPVGGFLSRPPQEHVETLMVNCHAPLVLAHAVGQAMARRRRGGMIFLSSLSATQGTPVLAHYAATKAWNLILAEGLWAELQDQGIDVLAATPGPIATPGLASTEPHPDAPAHRLTLSPEAAANDALDALGRGPFRVPGALARWSSRLGSLLPRRARLQLYARGIRALYPQRWPTR